MPKHTLSICQSCHRSSEERPEHQQADGTQLLEQLRTLCAERFCIAHTERSPELSEALGGAIRQ